MALKVSLKSKTGIYMKWQFLLQKRNSG